MVVQNVRQQQQIQGAQKISFFGKIYPLFGSNVMWIKYSVSPF